MNKHIKTKYIVITFSILSIFFLADIAKAMTVTDNGAFINVSTASSSVVSASKSDLTYDNNFINRGSNPADMYTYNSISTFFGWWSMGSDSVLRLYGDDEYSYVVFKNGVVNKIYNNIQSFSDIPNNWGLDSTTTIPVTGVTDGDNLIAFLIFISILLQIFGGMYKAIIGIKVKKMYYD